MINNMIDGIFYLSIAAIALPAGFLVSLFLEAVLEVAYEKVTGRKMIEDEEWEEEEND